mmetsp:Transcript_9976/g.8801  ORF Transcript_9976/g.8801 Transcript_9976/m.8801 type:complete len:104 (+) Transcript_9976:797-1108(+)
MTKSSLKMKYQPSRTPRTKFFMKRRQKINNIPVDTFASESEDIESNEFDISPFSVKQEIDTNIVIPSGALNTKKKLLALPKERYKQYEVNKMNSEINGTPTKH